MYLARSAFVNSTLTFRILLLFVFAYVHLDLLGKIINNTYVCGAKEYQELKRLYICVPVVGIVKDCRGLEITVAVRASDDDCINIVPVVQ